MSALLAAGTALVLAATPVTLDEVRQQSRQNTHSLLSELERQRAEQDVTLARSALLPQVGLNGSANRRWVGTQRVAEIIPDPSTGELIEVERDRAGSVRNDFGLTLGLNQLLFDGARWARLAQAGATAEAARGQETEQRATSELEGVRRFYNLLRTQSAIGVLEATVRRSEQQVERAQALFQAGRAGKGEVLSAQANLGNDRISVLRQQSSLARAQADLATWLARPGTEELAAQDPGTLAGEPEAGPALGAALEQAKQNRPLLAALGKQVEAARSGRLAAQSAFLPSVSGGLTYGRGAPDLGPVFNDWSRQNTVSATLTVRWDLFNGFATSAQVGQAGVAVRRAELDLAQAGRELEGEVRAASRALEAQLAASRIARDNREVAAQALALAEERFRAGAGSTLEVRDAQLKLTQAELNLLESRIDLEIARFALKRAVGDLTGAQGETR